LTFDSSTTLSITWNPPVYNGGFALKNFYIYVNNVLTDTVDPSEYTYQLTGLTLGSTYKIEVSSDNEIGESALSDANTVLFANVPSAPTSMTLTSTKKPTITASWTAPSLSNGDVVKGYKVYVDDG
jgi:hypothetical protein